jgi:outer membrane protein insertion porin family
VALALPLSPPAVSRRAWHRVALPLLATALRLAADAGAACGAPPAPRVAALHFEGARAFETDHLQRFLETRPTRLWYRRRFDADVFAADLRNLQLFYRTEGFLQACVSAGGLQWSADSSRVTPTVRVQEGRRWGVDSVHVRGLENAGLGDPLAGLHLRTGGPYRPAALARDRRALLELLAQHAYLDAQVTEDVRADGGRVTVVYDVQPNAPARVGRIEVEGLRKTRPHVVLRELQFDSGAALRSDVVAASQAALIGTGLFESVDIAPLPGQQGRAAKDVRVRVVEKPSGDASLGSGYGSVEGARIRLQLRQLNLRGTGRQLGLDLRAAERRRLAELSATEPWLLGWRLALDGQSAYDWIREPSFTTESVRGGAALVRHLTRTWRVDAGYQLRRTLLLEARVQEARPQRANRVGKITVAFSRETRDDLFDARRGGFVRFELGLAHTRLGSSQGFWSAAFVARRVVELGSRLRLAAGMQQSSLWLQEAGGELPIEERLYAGGDGSVRGFRRHAIGPRDAAGVALGGNHLHQMSLEMRLQLSRRFEAVLFADAAQLARRAESLRLADYAVGAGPGLRLRTPFGLLRADVAWPLTDEGRDGMRSYFALGQAF